MADNSAMTNKIVKAIEDHGREIRDLRRSIENAAKHNKPPEVNQIFAGGEISQPPPMIHLAFMDPGDPRPSCWQHSGIGAKFTITSYPEHVTCKKCLKMIEENQ